jgi:lysophospholipase L1-like esterase
MPGPDARAPLPRHTRRLRPLVLLLAAAVVLTAASAGAAPAAGGGPRYYLALGDSLSVGVQPDASGRNQLTDEGYADVLARLGGQLLPQLELVKLGCPGETTTSMLAGGVCGDAGSSQLARAVAFLTANRGATVLVTLDIGANDIVGCLDRASGQIDEACVLAAFSAVATNLPRILAELRAAAGPDVPVVGMNYYDPFLSFWRQGPAGQALARRSAEILASYNQALGAAYQVAGMPVADVERAFATHDFDTIVPSPDGRVPLNVALICRWTWMCAPPPVGPNIHARASGYRVMAVAFVAALLRADPDSQPVLLASFRQGLAAARSGQAH